MGIPFRSLAVVMALAGFAWAGNPQPVPTQPRPQPGQPGQPGIGQPAPGRVAAPGNVEHFLVGCLLNSNKAEVTLAKIAQKQAQSKEVQSFAEAMVKDHSEIIAKLERLSDNREGQPGKSGQDPRNTSSTQPTNRQTDPPSSTSGIPAGSGAGTGASPANPPTGVVRTEYREDARGDQGRFRGTLLQIKQEIDEKCLATKERELRDKQGAEFDECYMGMQVGAHLEMADVLSVFKNHATSPELQKLINEGIQITDRHLDHAKQLAKNLKRDRAE